MKEITGNLWDYYGNQCSVPREYLCPKCKQPLQEIRYPSDSMLNRDQWESQLPGDLFCAHHNNHKGNKPYAYFWKSSLAESPSESAPAPEADDERAKFATAMLGSLKLCGIEFHEELVEEGGPWEVYAEPEPRYFETLTDAVRFYAELAKLPAPEGMGRDARMAINLKRSLQRLHLAVKDCARIGFQESSPTTNAHHASIWNDLNEAQKDAEVKLKGYELYALAHPTSESGTKG